MGLQGNKGIGQGSDCYYIPSQALNLKGFATVVRKPKWEHLGQLVGVMEGAENRPGDWQVRAASVLCLYSVFSSCLALIQMHYQRQDRHAGTK